MCKAFSCLVTRGKVYWKAGVDSHEELLINPFKIKPPTKITEEHLNLLKVWASVRDSVGDSVRASVWASVGAYMWAPVGDSVWAYMWAPVGASVWDSVEDSVRAYMGAPVGASVGDSVWAYMGAPVGDSVWASVGASVGAYTGAPVWASVWDSVGDSVGAYMGSLFPQQITEWKNAPRCAPGYPYQSCVDLWKQGIVSSFDGKIWRLHGGGGAKVLWAGA
jgi:hypothetical protein